MRQKVLCILLALTLALALTACYKTEDVTISTTAPVVTEEQTTKTETTTEAADEKSKTASTTVVKNEVNLTGTWQDRYSQRATMEVRGGKDQVYRIHIHWGDSAFQSEDWTMSGTFNDSTGELVYKDAVRKTITFDENGGSEKEEVHYKNGTGKFLYKNGEIRWQDNQDDYVKDCVFER